MLAEMLGYFGFSRALVNKTFQESEGTMASAVGSVVHSGHLWQVQRVRGKGLSDLDNRIPEYLKEQLVMGRMSHIPIISKPSDFTPTIVFLERWSLHIIIGAVQTAYFGDHLDKIQNQFTRNTDQV